MTESQIRVASLIMAQSIGGDEMKVRIFCGVHAYAMIEDGAMRMDIRLDHGKSASELLRSYAADQERSARDAMRKAEFARQAADVLERERAE